LHYSRGNGRGRSWYLSPGCSSTSIASFSSVKLPNKKLVPVHKWGKGKEESDTRMMAIF
jgi:hypothetical protein